VVNEKQIIPDCINRDGSFNGSIDLLVRIRRGETDQYYVFDWKTNSLKNGYDDDNVKSVMEEADYLLQYRLYCLAASKWLGGEAVAGAVYLFVRGGENGKDCGIYTEEFTEEHRQEAVDYVTEKIRGCADDTL